MLADVAAIAGLAVMASVGVAGESSATWRPLLAVVGTALFGEPSGLWPQYASAHSRTYAD